MIAETVTRVRFDSFEIGDFERLRCHIYKAWPTIKPGTDSELAVKMLNRLTQYHLRTDDPDNEESYTEAFDAATLDRFARLVGTMDGRMHDKEAEIAAINAAPGSPDEGMRAALLEDFDVAIKLANTLHRLLCEAKDRAS